MRTHGVSAYSVGCRCDICRKARAVYTRQWRAKHPRPARRRLPSPRPLPEPFAEFYDAIFGGRQGHALRLVEVTPQPVGADERPRTSSAPTLTPHKRTVTRRLG